MSNGDVNREGMRFADQHRQDGLVYGSLMPPPSKEFWENILTPDVRRASHVAHSVDMLSAMPGAMDRASDPYVQVACMEDFLVHARLLLEFLMVHPANAAKDFSARDFGWNGPPTAEWSHLEQVWLIACRHLVHFSNERAPDSVHDVQEVDTSAAGLSGVAAHILDLFAMFVVDLESRGHTESMTFRRCLQRARQNLVDRHDT